MPETGTLGPSRVPHTPHPPHAPSELDLALVHAMQLRPRASWSQLAPPLGVTAGTLARRWRRLCGAGLAWVTAAPGREFSRSRCTAFVRLACRPGATARVTDELTRRPEVATVEVTGGGAELLLDVLAPDLRGLGRLLTGDLGRLPGVTGVSSLFATSLYVEGSRWRLGSLDPAQRTALGGARAPGDRPRSPALDPVDRALLDGLVKDGRLSWAELAERTGASTATVRRRLRRLESSGVVTFRCDIAPSLAGRPVPVSLLANAPSGDVDTVHQVLAAHPDCRLAAAVTGPANVFATFWLSDLADLPRLERSLSRRLPALSVTDRIVGLRTVKRMGHLLDEEGRHVEAREFAPW